VKRLLAAIVLLAAGMSAWAQGTRFPQDYQGLWWNPLESGWGVGVFDHGTGAATPISSVLFVYGADGRPTWYIAPDLRDCPANFTPFVSVTCGGTIYRTGGPWFGAPFIASSVSVREAGQWSANFTGQLHGVPYARPRELALSLTIDGTTLRRDHLLLQDIAGSALANFDASAAQFTGLWWDPDEPGWGVGVFHYRNAVFAVLFVYGADRQPTWFVTVLRESFPMANAPGATYRQFDGPLFETRGTAWFAPGFTLTQARQAGTMQLVFPSASTASLTYSVDGTSVTKALRRLSSLRP
jgi:hypothetical protein